MTAGLVAVFIIAAFTKGCATGESVISPAFKEDPPNQIAIVDISGDIRGSVAKNQVGDYFAMELFRKGYEVIERRRVEHILEEQDFQRSDVSSSQEAARIGELLNVPAVAMLDISTRGEKLSLTGRIVRTETGSVLWIGSGRGGSGQTLATIGGAAVGAVAGSQIGGGSGRTAATIGGAVLGGVAGHSLSPQASRMVQRTIKKMIKELPER